jgi:hypothetical protein
VHLYQRQFFNLFGDLVPNPITITDDLPTNEDKFVFAKNADPEELWPMLVEKAFAADKGSYDAIIGGWGNRAMEQLTGVESETYKPNNVTMEQLDNFYQQGIAMTASTKIAWKIIPDITDKDPLYTDGTLVPKHEYFVTDVDLENETITVANPWTDHDAATITLDEFQRTFRRLSTNPLE